MNGRIYDPTLGRFLQADPIIQAPMNSQSYNRYAYVFNNPLSYTDPSGYSAWTKFRDKILKPVVAIAITIYTGGAALAAGGWTGLGIAMAGGAASGFVMTGSLKGALTGAFSAAAFYGIGSYFQGAMEANKLREGLEVLENGLTTAQFAGKIATHAIAGGIMSDLNGGKFGHGFWAAGVTQAAGLKIDGIDASSKFSPARIMAAATLGGTISKISGGKFANGALTATFSRAFNDELHFNGKKLSWIDDEGKVIKEWSAVSGKRGSTVKDQSKEDYGPIPEGEYTVAQDKLQFWDDLSGLNKFASTMSPLVPGDHGAWPGGTTAWGESRVWLQSAAGTNVYGRSGFSIHGGSFAGSAGCIDMTLHMPAFTQAFQQYNQNMTLTVKY
ncbi:DUF2778 domain-containing protein [Thalassotalea sp. LPB0316]|uniref:RHS repeat domain-containing protein n=1 Tax=Thalassotalea sp. LPB0316 TaxID=2769490 RepID=UPI001866A586|nr:RHS repeat-associated core domain-containing protein [Thalassotalea sp. LPB0316]QOL26172.1 DUF2778 domain-containing protein [Thalassotalea sp. LPB0316]